MTSTPTPTVEVLQDPMAPPCKIAWVTTPPTSHPKLTSQLSVSNWSQGSRLVVMDTESGRHPLLLRVRLPDLCPHICNLGNKLRLLLLQLHNAQQVVLELRTDMLLLQPGREGDGRGERGERWRQSQLGDVVAHSVLSHSPSPCLSNHTRPPHASPIILALPMPLQSHSPSPCLSNHTRPPHATPHLYINSLYDDVKGLSQREGFPLHVVHLQVVGKVGGGVQEVVELHLNRLVLLL